MGLIRPNSWIAGECSLIINHFNTTFVRSSNSNLLLKLYWSRRADGFTHDTFNERWRPHRSLANFELKEKTVSPSAKPQHGIMFMFNQIHWTKRFDKSIGRVQSDLYAHNEYNLFQRKKQQKVDKQQQQKKTLLNKQRNNQHSIEAMIGDLND